MIELDRLILRQPSVRRLLILPRRILIDVGTQLSADEELENLAAAEAAVNSRDLDRTKIVNQLNGEVKRESNTYIHEDMLSYDLINEQEES